ncbi:MAG: CBS domain-containing protein [Nitrospirota bacterium]|uniref:CBS-domain-containing protein n=1 Tax=Candidatus Magnetominusculus xianensis TaxID=1748249 RepID=A0ABR5SD75_9BACT|nr:CBS domain-containing protein [Candidatus Magnetominusculus xianensis]KWT78991.1 CBS-domain-containing protein [Candidatus Magnetominusculus xianensis]MBF0405002.1 CBS domain-containing protein [Nitrospirota bacterium]
MLVNKRVKDLMKDIFEFPHIPYWFTIRQAIGIIKSAGLEKAHQIVVLVFEEKYHLVGTLGIKEILMGLEPVYLKSSSFEHTAPEGDIALSLVWDTMFDMSNKELLQKPVSDILYPIENFAGIDDHLAKAAHTMLRNDLFLLPVLENKRKLVGIVTLLDIFNELSGCIG